LKLNTKIVQGVWLLVAVGVIVLFCAAMANKNKKYCADIKIEITGANDHLFIDEKDVLQLIVGHSEITTKRVSDIDLKAIELELEKTSWIKNAELYFDNKQILQVKIEERQPVARVFTVEGNSFYVDTAGVNLPLSDKQSARVPMFTNFPKDTIKTPNVDSILLKGIVKMASYIMEDSFWNAQIQQINITPQYKFEIVPTLGNQLILFGTATDIEEKFNNLYTFYTKAWVQNGINTYSTLDVQFKNQVVGVRKDAIVVPVDSAKAKAAITALMKGGNVLEAVMLTDSTKKPKETKTVITKKKLEVIDKNNNKSSNNSFSIVKKSKLEEKKTKHPIKKREE